MKASQQFYRHHNRGKPPVSVTFGVCGHATGPLLMLICDEPVGTFKIEMTGDEARRLAASLVKYAEQPHACVVEYDDGRGRDWKRPETIREMVEDANRRRDCKGA